MMPTRTFPHRLFLAVAPPVADSEHATGVFLRVLLLVVAPRPLLHIACCVVCGRVRRFRARVSIITRPAAPAVGVGVLKT